jgi:hypothetical protein
MAKSDQIVNAMDYIYIINNFQKFTTTKWNRKTFPSDSNSEKLSSDWHLKLN